MSRTPVREALKRLSAEGLLTLDPARRTIVADADTKALEEIFVVYEALAGPAARLAADRISGGQIAKLDSANAILRNSLRFRHWDSVSQASFEFHDLLSQAANNTRLRHLAGSLMDFARRFSIEAFAGEDRATIVLADYLAITEALRMHDRDRAEATTRQHVASARTYMIGRRLADLQDRV